MTVKYTGAGRWELHAACQRDGCHGTVHASGTWAGLNPRHVVATGTCDTCGQTHTVERSEDGPPARFDPRRELK